jgi:predicted kinase
MMFEAYKNNKCVFALCGPPASGKSTYLEKIRKFSENKHVHFPYVVICPDQIIRELNNGEYLWSPSAAKLAWEESYERVKKEVEEQKNHIIFDSTMCSLSRRAKFIHKLSVLDKEANYHLVLVRLPYVDTEVLVERDNNRVDQRIGRETIERMVNDIAKNPPSVKEGWDYILEADKTFTL